MEITNTLFTGILLHVDRFTLSFCLFHSYGLYNLTHNLHSKMLAEASSQIHFGELSPWLERQREFLHSLVFSFDHLAISQLLPLLGDGKTGKCPYRSLQHLHISIFIARGCKPEKILSISMFYDWSNGLDASQATLAMAGHGKTERMPGQKLAWPALALVWPQAWSGLWGWPGLGLCGLMCLPGSLWPGSAKAALCCLLVLWHASPSLWTGITTP